MEDLDRFVAVVDAGSISEAARTLDLPRATLSRQITRLEERLGVRLLHRSTRRLTLTEAGAELYRRGRRIVDDVAEAEAAVRFLDGTPRGTLRLTTMPRAGQALAPMLFSFLDAYPEVSVDLHATTDHVDLVAAGFDLALRAGRLRDPNLIAIRLATTWLRAVASPGYLDANGRPSSVVDLAGHACLRGFEPDGRPADRWPTRDGGSVQVTGRISSNDLGLLLEAALDGRGIALLPGMFSDRHVEQGRLEVVLEDQIGQTSGLHLVYPEREFLPPKVRAFLDLATTELRDRAGWSRIGPEDSRNEAGRVSSQRHAPGPDRV